ncbi:hypothetical protein OH77DRAFT_1517315 [Trametes cingulata]|nr:hypothetical protein OH77DRAFT_1517315 [Trametes cingulata]
MPSFFHRHKDTSPPQPEEGDATTPMDPSSMRVESPDELSREANGHGGSTPVTPSISFPDPGNEDLDTSKRLDAAYQIIGDAQSGFQKYQGSKSVKLVNMSGDMLGAIRTDVNTAQSYSSPLKSAYESEAMKMVRDGVNTLVDSLPGLIKALDEVAKLHPFIGIAVSAFRVVVELDLKRRDNDKKIAALFLEMKDMMEALLQIRTIKEKERIGPGGMTIEGRMQALVKQTADDITACGNACDTYAKKRLIVKVIKGSVWESTLKGYIDLFAKRRKDFTFALSIHTGMGVDDANRKLSTLDAKMDVLLEFFTKAVTPEQRELAILVQKKGGAMAVMSNNDALKELLNFKPTTAATGAKRGVERDSAVEHNGPVGENNLDALKTELFESPELAIRKNFEVFERKFKMQQRELAEEIKRTVHHEGDRVIEAVTSGPHDRIIDPEIHEIWKEMRWPGHVKARHFVLALRDYYRQQLELKRRKRGEQFISRISDDDEWALEWININRLQAIAEAFDDDASGFITIAEVNHFTSSRPKDWSLLKWLAYWAVGWQITATYYRDKITEITAKMFSLEPLIHAANAQASAAYLETVWKRISTLTSSILGNYQPDALKERFQDYVDAEEQRLREGLETVRYDIDAMDTLTLITGPGRIEKYLLPLLYLLLKRDFEIFRLCRKTVVHKDELWDSADTIVWVFDAVGRRHDELETLFKQQKLDVAQQFKAHACELFDYWHDDTEFWSLERLREMEFIEVDYIDEEEDQIIDATKLLNYPSAADNLYAVVEDIVTEDDAKADEAVRMILGRWNGFLGAEQWPLTAMQTFCFHASVVHSMYEASDVAPHGTSFTIIGGYKTKEDGSVEYNFSRTYSARLKKTYFTATLSEDGGTLSGNWGYVEESKPYRFLFMRIPPEVLIARPPPAEFEENRIRALWKYALTAAHNEARRKMLSWSWIKERRDIRKEYIELLEREADEVCTDDDIMRFSVLDRTSTCEDVRFFNVVRDYRKRPVASHLASCDACGDRIYGSRLICLKCGSEYTLDFCDKPTCRDAVKLFQSRTDMPQPHSSTHDFVKVRRAFHQFREIGKILRMSDKGLERARRLLTKAARRAETTSDSDGEVEERKTTGVQREEAYDSDSETGGVEPTCISCSSKVSYPCWYCIDCLAESNVFVCQECDEKKGGVTVGDHQHTHSLVRCTEPETEDDDSDSEGEDNTEERLSAVEDKLATLTVQMERIEKLLESLAVSRST